MTVSSGLSRPRRRQSGRADVRVARARELERARGSRRLPRCVPVRRSSRSARGLVGCRADERDRRVARVSLTEEGRRLIARLVPEQVGYEASLLSALGTDRQRELADVLSELLVLLEGRLGGVRF